jgi:hypothetical protein
MPGAENPYLKKVTGKRRVLNGFELNLISARRSKFPLKESDVPNYR